LTGHKSVFLAAGFSSENLRLFFLRKQAALPLQMRIYSVSCGNPANPQYAGIFLQAVL
jgi:hypothetical protein